jgi:hypothetical protein
MPLTLCSISAKLLAWTALAESERSAAITQARLRKPGVGYTAMIISSPMLAGQGEAGSTIEMIQRNGLPVIHHPPGCAANPNAHAADKQHLL